MRPRVWRELWIFCELFLFFSLVSIRCIYVSFYNKNLIQRKTDHISETVRDTAQVTINHYVLSDEMGIIDLG